MAFEIQDEIGHSVEVGMFTDKTRVDLSIWGLLEGVPFRLTRDQARDLGNELLRLSKQVED